MNLHPVQVAISADFLKAYAGLQKSQQKGVRAWIEKFRADPTNKSINYKSLEGMRDPKVRSVRIDQQYRAIVIHPPKDDVYLLVWVDNHDEAVEWARNKLFEVNRFTGSFQVYEAEPGLAPADAVASPAARPLEVSVDSADDAVPPGFLLAGHRYADLLLLGVPEPLLPAVRALRTDNDLDGLARYLPPEAADALFLLAAGFGVEATIDELDRRERAAPPGVPVPTPAPIDTEDFAAALQRPESGRSFKLLEDDAELAAILAAHTEQWRIFLHPSQAKLVTLRSNGSARVLGGAGTGKTVVAMHRARHLARSVFTQPGQRVLVTTFTKNLAADIRTNLKRMCGPEFERIDVKHLQEVARDILRGKGITVPKAAAPKQLEAAWSRALAAHALEFPAVFYREEWSKVVQAQDVTDQADYLRARRAGRGQRLSRAQRLHVWDVLVEYRQQLDLMGLSEHADLIREARLALKQSPSRPYTAVIADEIQDFRTADLILLRALVPEGPNDVFVVGDPHQRIYGHVASLSACGINVRGQRSRRLRINYRTTHEIRNWAVARLQGLEIDDLDEGVDSLKGERSLRSGAPPDLRLFPDITAEARHIAELIRAWLGDGVSPDDICVAVRTGDLLKDHYAPALRAHGLDTVVIDTDLDHLPPGVRIATMHRVKGLEFPRMILAGLHRGTMPYEDAAYAARDELARQLYDEGERKLLYVAATRARDLLVLTGHGERSSLL
jgi:superfamily I DNA/RNA helicase/mRNA-degrading endonuclease RelE of RelBE toxin-antitoxin system